MSRASQAAIGFGRVALVVVVLGACGFEEKSTLSDATSASTSDATTDTPTGGTGAPFTCVEHSQTDDCCCFEELRFEESGLDLLMGTRSTCGVQPLCPEMSFECDTADVGCLEGVLTTENADAIACSLRALADGKAGRVTWSIKNQTGQGGRTQVWLDLVGDGTLFRQRNDSLDLCFEVFPVQHLPLPASGDYEACLAEGTWESQFDCLRKVSFGEPIETCLDGEEYTPASSPGNGC